MQHLTNYSFGSLTLAISLWMIQGKHLKISSHNFKQLPPKFTKCRSQLLLLVKIKPFKYTTSLKNLLANLEASLYSPKGIKWTIFEKQSVTLRLKNTPSNKASQKPSQWWYLTKALPICLLAMAYLLVFCYLPLFANILLDVCFYFSL